MFVEPKQNEYIFLIDRSGSMYETINLARQALQLFLQSLSFGSTFQIVSYGSDFEFLFKDKRSVEYNDKTFQQAFDAVSTFQADFGGTEILAPLEAIFKMSKPKKDQETHILLLTDGAVHNTAEIVELIAKNATLTTRVHTFGVGNGADEALIKRSAYAGFGQYYFIFNENEIEEKVIMSLTNTHLNYRVLTKLKILDAKGEQIVVPFVP